MMSPAKKKATPKRKKPCPEAAVAAPPPPAPVLTAPQKRFWAVIEKRTLIGVSMFLVGVSFALGYQFSDKAHLHEKVALYFAFAMMLFGALMVDFENAKNALKELAGGAKAAKS